MRPVNYECTWAFLNEQPHIVMGLVVTLFMLAGAVSALTAVLYQSNTGRPLDIDMVILALVCTMGFLLFCIGTMHAHIDMINAEIEEAERLAKKW